MSLSNSRRDELWEVALADSGIAETSVELCWLDRPARALAWYCPPGIGLGDMGESGLDAKQAERLSHAANRHRVAVHTGSHGSEAVLLRSMRHELQHAVQFEEGGTGVMCLAELLRQAIDSAYPSVARDMVQVATPLERQAHQAASAIVSRMFGPDALGRCGAWRLLELCGRTDVEGEISRRTIAFAALLREQVGDRIVNGRPIHGWAEAMLPGAWTALLSDNDVVNFAAHAQALHPSREEVEGATKPGRPWLPVVTGLLEGEQRGLALLGREQS